jgi:hypothetical protein
MTSATLVISDQGHALDAMWRAYKIRECGSHRTVRSHGARCRDDEIRLLLVGAYPRVQKCSLHIRRLMPQPRQRVEFGDTKRFGAKSQMRGTLEGAARGFEQLAHSVETGWQA